MAPGQRAAWYPWPYTEGLTIEEATNELTLLVTGAYGKPLPHSMGSPLRLHTPLGRLDFITTVTTFGAPHELTLAELAVETLLPADAATAARLQALHATLPPR